MKKINVKHSDYIMIKKILDNLKPELRTETKQFLNTLSKLELKGILALSDNVQPLEIERLIIEHYLKGNIKAKDVPSWKITKGIMFQAVKEKFNQTRN